MSSTGYGAVVVSNPDKLARAASQIEAASVTHAVQVQRGIGLSLAGFVAMVTAGVVIDLLVGAAGVDLPVFIIFVLLAVLSAWLKHRGVVLDGVIGRSGGTFVLYDASPLKRRPVRQVRQRYPAGIEPVFKTRRAWWLLPTLVVGDEEWFVAQAYQSVAERWYGSATPTPDRVGQ